MSAEVLEFDGITRLDIPAERIIAKAQEAGLVDVVIIGHTADGHEYFASSKADGGSVLWMMGRAKMALLNIADRDDLDL